MDFNAALKILETYGLPVAGLAVWTYLVVRCCRYVGVRLFDEDKGVVTRVANRAVEFIDETSKTQASMVKTQEALADSAQVAHEGMKERNDLVRGVKDKTDSLHRLAGHYCDLVEVACGRLGPDVKHSTDPYIKAIRHELENGTRPG